MKLTALFKEFFQSSKSGGVVLIVSTAASLILANTTLKVPYHQFWDFHFFHHSMAHWVNDGLMTIFFLLIGLELEREIYKGELSDIKNASLPIAAAIGGMLVPALIFLSFNFNTPTQPGAGIPMATDIAFAIGILSLLGNKVPASLKIFLTALAVIDDLGAIIIIALFYTATISLVNLSIALGIFGALLILNRMKVQNVIPYLMGGVTMWYFMLNSGVHATITGVLLAFAIPFGDGGSRSTSYRLQHYLHLPVAFIILPLFALANTAVTVGAGWQHHLLDVNSLGIITGLIVGKPLGILLFSFAAVSFGLSKLPENLDWKHVFGAGLLGGIGFTMSVFITILAFSNDDVISISKISILLASLIAGTVGYLWLKMVLRKTVVE